MKHLFGLLFERHQDLFYVVFRVLVGLLFFQHGAQKLFGLFGAKGSVELFSLMGLAGTIEFFGGLAIALGLLTRLSALFGIASMAWAYFLFHMDISNIPDGLVPIMNKGQLALLYLAAFLVIFAYGAKKFCLEE